MSPGRSFAFIDEYGHRSGSPKSSDHFVLAAAILVPGSLPRSHDFLESIRAGIGCSSGEVVKWRKLTHQRKVYVAQTLAKQSFLTIASVVVCKRKFEPGVKRPPDEDIAYLYTLRFLLERLSWWARDRNSILEYTLSHIVRMKSSALSDYEKALASLPECKIEWAALDPLGGRIDQPPRVEQLQIADWIASAIGQAFEPDRFGNVEPRYLTEMSQRLYRYPGGALTSYGLKMHPWKERGRAEHPWVEGL